MSSTETIFFHRMLKSSGLIPPADLEIGFEIYWKPEGRNSCQYNNGQAMLELL